MKKIVFMGTPDFAVASLKKLVESGKFDCCHLLRLLGSRAEKTTECQLRVTNIFKEGILEICNLEKMELNMLR